MIVEIALGIVLAFIMLAYLDRILVFSAIALVLGVIVIAIIGLYDYSEINIDSLLRIIGSGIMIFWLFYGGYLLYSYSSKIYKEIELIGFLPYLRAKNLIPSIITISIFIISCCLWLVLS